jgi:hypothetical protein
MITEIKAVTFKIIHSTPVLQIILLNGINTYSRIRHIEFIIISNRGYRFSSISPFYLQVVQALLPASEWEFDELIWQGRQDTMTWLQGEGRLIL